MTLFHTTNCKMINKSRFLCFYFFSCCCLCCLSFYFITLLFSFSPLQGHKYDTTTYRTDRYAQTVKTLNRLLLQGAVCSESILFVIPCAISGRFSFVKPNCAISRTVTVSVIRCMLYIISIFHGCMVWVELSVTRVTDRHHEACRVMPNSDPE